MRIEEPFADGRDERGRVCVWCGGDERHERLTREHLLPRSRGGSGGPENIAWACRRCNRRRRSRQVGSWVRAMLADGAAPRLDLVAGALGRLATSPRRPERDYAARQERHLRGLDGWRSGTGG